MNVLIINDDEVSLTLHKLMVMRSGISDSVVTMSNGKLALAYLSNMTDQDRGTHPDLILLDIHMPEMDGWEFLDHFDHLRSVFLNTRVVVTSFSSDEKELEKVKNYPVVIDFRSTVLSAQYLSDLKLA